MAVVLVATLLGPSPAFADALTPESGGSQNADDVDTLYKITLYIGLVIFLIVEARTGAVEDALTGSVVGLFVLAPLLGVGVGAAGAAIGGKLSELGFNQLIVKNILKALAPAGLRCSCSRRRQRPAGGRGAAGHTDRRSSRRPSLIGRSATSFVR